MNKILFKPSVAAVALGEGKKKKKKKEGGGRGGTPKIRTRFDLISVEKLQKHWNCFSRERVSCH